MNTDFLKWFCIYNLLFNDRYRSLFAVSNIEKFTDIYWLWRFYILHLLNWHAIKLSIVVELIILNYVS